MRLDLGKVSIVKVFRIFKWSSVLEYYDPSSPITNSQQIPCTIERYSSEIILFSHTQLVSLSQSVDIDPLHGLGWRDYLLSGLILYYSWLVGDFIDFLLMSWREGVGMECKRLGITTERLKLQVRDLFLQNTDIIQCSCPDHELGWLFLLR
jgi:hypothetical protein